MFAAVLISILTSIAFAKGHAHPSILKSQQKLKEKSRAEALLILQEALKVELKPAAAAEIKREIKRTNEIFLTDKGQNYFESAEIARFSSADGAAQKYEEALKIEGENTKILFGLALIEMKKKDCGKADNYIQKLLLADPRENTARFLQLSHRLCTSAENFTEEDRALLMQMPELRPVTTALLAKVEFERKNMSAAMSYAKEAIAYDLRYPTGYFWAVKVLEFEEQSYDTEAERYVELCRQLESVQRRKYQLDVFLCKDTEEVAKRIKLSAEAQK